ncbi:hypothetical protein AVEN_43643-1 [Araneus ventricosus]|uniref:Uncharacterized protein n=1 Tax=Araneus ventricosus TaxID=182803 RepID=A0A4Y2FCZ9_ARAVE|nr:hypothetical protein AVEN_43643-1 [Araneus ventricosus]
MSPVHETPVNSGEDLVARIAEAAGEVRDTPGIFTNVRSSTCRRCEACITARGTYPKGCKIQHGPVEKIDDKAIGSTAPKGEEKTPRPSAGLAQPQPIRCLP